MAHISRNRPYGKGGRAASRISQLKPEAEPSERILKVESALLWLSDLLATLLSDRIATKSFEEVE